jgi:hypothetical protein
MKLNLLFLILSIFFLVWMPTGAGLLLDTFLYSSWVWYQFCFDRISLQNAILFGSYSALSILYFGLGIIDVLPLTGIIVYSAFAMSYVYTFFKGVAPWTRRNSLLYFLIAVSSIIFSFILKPHASYIYVPLGIFSSGILLRKRLLKWDLFTNPTSD